MSQAINRDHYEKPATEGDYDRPCLDTVGKRFALDEWASFCRRHRDQWRQEAP